MISSMLNFSIGFLIAITVTMDVTNAAPQFRPIAIQPRVFANEIATPYEYQYKVDYSPTNTFYGKRESGDAAGRVTGSYYVYLPDKQLMTVEYFVNGDSGFVPKITFSKQASHPGATRL